MNNFFTEDDGQFWQEPDYLLALLVSFMANKLNTEFGITLMVNGAVITGTLISERSYLERINTLFQSIVRAGIPNPTDEDIQLIEESFGFEDMLEDFYPDEDEEDEDDEDDDETDLPASPIRHLHLRDPFILYPGSAMSFGESPLPLLRLRLASVNGWLPGRVNVIDSDEGSDFSPPFAGNRFKQ